MYFDSPSLYSSQFLPTSPPIWIYSLLKILFHYFLGPGLFLMRDRKESFSHLRVPQWVCLALGQSLQHPACLLV